jgi:diadenosine tetraphosphate (Ap4A) HIT family hydrolase
VSTIFHERVAAARAGTNPTTICRLRSGWAVLGDPQVARGYSLLLPDPVVGQLNDLTGEVRRTFLYEMSLLGDAVKAITGAVRINYEILGNQVPALHAHVVPRFADEPAELREKPIWYYDWSAAPRFDAGRDGPLIEAIAKCLSNLGFMGPM